MYQLRDASNRATERERDMKQEWKDGGGGGDDGDD